jgi:tRNA threonylcarbamoyladenosine biosynthesis protein TsaB
MTDSSRASPPRLLIVETATARGLVATASGAEVLHEIADTEPARRGEGLLERVALVLRRTGWELGDVQLFAVGIGPGSFTGVRVGVATAKGLALATRRPLVGVVSLDAMSHAARARFGPVRVVPVLDAKKGELFVCVHDQRGRREVEPAHVRREELAAWVARFLGPTADAVAVGSEARALGTPGLRHLSCDECDSPSARSSACLALERWTAVPEPGAELAWLEPLYVRPPDARPSG